MPTLEQNFLPCNHRLHTTPTLATVSIISGQARLFSADTNLTLKTTHDPTACLIRGPHRGDHVERQIPRATHPPKIKLTQKFLDCGHDAVWYPTSIEAHVPPSRGSSSRAGSLLSGGVGGTDAEAVWRAEVSYVDGRCLDCESRAGDWRVAFREVDWDGEGRRGAVAEVVDRTEEAVSPKTRG